MKRGSSWFIPKSIPLTNIFISAMLTESAPKRAGPSSLDAKIIANAMKSEAKTVPEVIRAD